MNIISNIINPYRNFKNNIKPDNVFFGRKKQIDTFVSSFKLSEKDIQILKKQMRPYPEDIRYRKKLFIERGTNPSEYYKLRSVIGTQELKETIKEFNSNENAYMPGKRPESEEYTSDSHNLTNVETGNYRANLHIHSVNSDGKMSVQEILDSANKYAEYLKKTKNKPFYIAITDHNTVKGCMEAIDIIRRNPKKYENLRVVLGCEVTLKMDSIDKYELKKPHTVHLLLMGINPYDEELNGFLDDLVEHKSSPMNPKKVYFKDAMKILSNQKYCSFALAHPAWPYLPNIMQEPDSYLDAMRKYIMIFAENAKNKALYTERYYQSYDGKIAQDKKLLQTVKDVTKQLGLYSSGGVDTHGRRIFYCDSNE